MREKIFLGILGFSFVLELAAGLTAFFYPEAFLAQFKIQLNLDTLLLSHIFGWLLSLLTLICGITFVLVRKRVALGWSLSYLLGIFWIGIGIYLGVRYPQTMYFDSVRGFALLAAAWASRSLAGP